MADDLRAALTKVEKSSGKKRFFFAYATGKRADGKGDGDLVVSTKKPKKAQLEEECEVKDFYEGFCWSNEAGEIIYLAGRGKKLSATHIAKMKLLAKKLTTRQYEFAIPTPEQEAAAEKLGTAEEGEGMPSEGEQGSAPTGQAPGGLDAALVGWQTARQTAIASLKQLLKAIVQEKDPEANAAIIQVDAILKNLTAEPRTPQQVAALEEYLGTDDVVAEVELPNPFGVTVAVRGPLLAALTPLKQAVGSS
ncbi:MAG: hypothetical protein L0Y71_13335 [Gemmataceae bacterium]|nr:hypothetical protein [Gemmataceae bacterium]